MVEKERVEINTGDVSWEHWHLLASLDSRRCGPIELLQVIRNHWKVENSLHHVKDRSWDEDVHTQRRLGLGEVYPTWVNAAPNPLRLEGWYPIHVYAPESQDLHLPPNPNYRPPRWPVLLTLQLPCFPVQGLIKVIHSDGRMA